MWDIYKSDTFIFETLHATTTKTFEERAQLVKESQEICITVADAFRNRLFKEEGLNFTPNESLILLVIYIFGLAVQIFYQMKLLLAKKILPNYYKILQDKDASYIEMLLEYHYSIHWKLFNKENSFRQNTKTKLNFEDHRFNFSYGLSGELLEPETVFIRDSVWQNWLAYYNDIDKHPKDRAKFILGLTSEIFMHPSTLFRMFSHFMLDTLTFFENTKDFFQNRFMNYSGFNIKAFLQSTNVYPEFTNSFWLLSLWNSQQKGYILKSKDFSGAVESDFFHRWAELHTRTNIIKCLYADDDEKDLFIMLLLVAFYSFITSLGCTKEETVGSQGELAHILRPSQQQYKKKEFGNLSGFIKNIGEDWHIEKQVDFHTTFDHNLSFTKPIIHKLCSKKHINNIMEPFTKIVFDSTTGHCVADYNAKEVWPFWIRAFDSILHSQSFKNSRYKPYNSCYVMSVNTPNVDNIFLNEGNILNLEQDAYYFFNFIEQSCLVTQTDFIEPRITSFFGIALNDFLNSFVYDNDQKNIFMAQTPVFNKISV